MGHSQQTKDKIAQSKTKTRCNHGHLLADAYIVQHFSLGKWRWTRNCRPCQIKRMEVQRKKKKREGTNDNNPT